MSTRTWIFAGLFLLLGLPLAIDGDGEWNRYWAGASAFCLGCWALSMVRDALKTGAIRFHSVVRYADHPRLFLAAGALVAAAGVGVIAASAWVILARA